MSIRKELIDRTREFWKKQEGRRYFVKRGVINWASFDFGANPFAVAILIDDMSIGRHINGMNLSFEIATSMPISQEHPEIDDNLLDELLHDCEELIKEMMNWTDTSGDSLALNVSINLARAIEFHDSSKHVQGVILTIPVEY